MTPEDIEDMRLELEAVQANLRRKLSSIPECDSILRTTLQQWEAELIAALGAEAVAS